jgi:NDP-sugar pyrophosphorylase family protein
MVALAEQGARLEPVFIDGQWREIDTPQDLAAAQGMVAAWDR